MDTSSIVTPSVARVPLHTDTAVNQRIRDEAQQRIAYFRAHRDEIGQRIKQLNEEWDVERALAMGSSCLSLAGIALGLSGRKRGALLTLAVQSFYLQHSIRGWCPPLPLLRRLGFRTPMEIEQERAALKALRESVTPNPAPEGGLPEGGLDAPEGGLPEGGLDAPEGGLDTPKGGLDCGVGPRRPSGEMH